MIARFAIVVVSLLATWPAFAQTMTADMARRFVTGKLFEFNCFDGSRGAGRIYADGSVIGTIQFRGAGPVRSVWLPTGTLRVRGDSYCAALKGMAFEPCFDLSRTSAHRKAMFQNMAVSLFEHELIKTTLPKAKELRRVAEPLNTLAKEDSVANRRLAFDRTRSKAAVGKLFNDLGKRYANRQGGYLRILKCGFRAGDNAPMAYVELVDRPVAGEVE